VGPRAGLDDVEKRKFLTLPGLELRPLARPARSQSLYRLRYPGPDNIRIRNFYVSVLKAHVIQDVCRKHFCGFLYVADLPLQTYQRSVRDGMKLSLHVYQSLSKRCASIAVEFLDVTR
jgi:hypothetical protein